MPITLSPGSSNAMYAAMLALAPECGWTLAWSVPKSAQARSRASSSASSTPLFDLGDLLHAPLVASALEARPQPQSEDLTGEAVGDDSPAHRQDVGVIVLPRQASREQIVAQRSPDSPHFVGHHLLPLPA